MQITAVSVTYGRKQNLGDYSSAHVEVSIWADIEEGEELNGNMQQLWAMAKENVKAQLLPLTSRQQAKAEEAFLGLPVELQKEIEQA